MLMDPFQTISKSESLTWSERSVTLEVIVSGSESLAAAKSFKSSVLGSQDLGPVLVPPTRDRDQNLACKPVAALFGTAAQEPRHALTSGDALPGGIGVNIHGRDHSRPGASALPHLPSGRHGESTPHLTLCQL